jgi:hypothetical protein
MLKYGEANPLNVFGLREVDHLPPHFEPVTFILLTKAKTIVDWIYENLEGRFWFGTVYNPAFLLVENHYDRIHCVAFEIASEATMFSLILDQINKNNTEFF